MPLDCPDSRVAVVRQRRVSQSGLRHAGVCLAVVLGTLVGAEPSLGAELPPQPNIPLGHGHFGLDSWSASAHRTRALGSTGPQGTQQPCLEVGGSWPTEKPGLFVGSGVGTCTPEPGRLTAHGPPVWEEVSAPSVEGAETTMTAVAMVFAPASRMVVVGAG